MPLSEAGNPTELLDARVDGAASAVEADPTGHEHLAACHWARAVEVAVSVHDARRFGNSLGGLLVMCPDPNEAEYLMYPQ